MHTKTIQELIDKFGGNALTVYCRYIDAPELESAIRYLCKQDGIDVNVRDHKGRNGLLAFLDNRKFINEYPESALEIVNLLISSGSDVLQTDDNKVGAVWKLMGASINPKTIFPIAQVLLENGADFNLIHPETKYNAAVLFLLNRDAMLYGKMAENPEEEAYYLHKLFELFLQHGVNLNGTKSFLNALLCDRSKHQEIFIETVKLALTSGADLNCDEMYGCLSSLCFFSHAGETRMASVLKLLIDSGIDVNQTDDDGVNALSYFLISINSLGSDELQVISLLCESGINVNQKHQVTRNGNKTETMDALRFACLSVGAKFSANEILLIARILVAHGANLKEKFPDILLFLFGAYIQNRLPSPTTNENLICATEKESYEEHQNKMDGGDELEEIKTKRLKEIKTRLKVQASFERWFSANPALSTICSNRNAGAYPHYLKRLLENDSQSTTDDEANFYANTDGCASPDYDQRIIDEESYDEDFEMYVEIDESAVDGPDEGDNVMDEDENDEGWYELIKFFIENGADGNSDIPESSMSLFLFLFLSSYLGKDFVKITELICKYGADVNKVFESQKGTRNAIYYLLINQHQQENYEDIIALLLKYGLNESFVHPDYQKLLVNV